MKKAYTLMIKVNVHALNLEIALKKLAPKLRDNRDITWGTPEYQGAINSTRIKTKEMRRRMNGKVSDR